MFTWAKAEVPGGSTRDPDLGVEIRQLEPPLEETSPVIDEIHFKLTKNNKIRIQLIGKADTDCFDKRDYVIQKETNKTLLVPRFSKKNPQKICKNQKLQPFSDIAGLMPLGESSSRHLRVLGFKGWYDVEVPQKYFENISSNEYGPLPPTPNNIKLEK